MKVHPAIVLASCIAMTAPAGLVADAARTTLGDPKEGGFVTTIQHGRTNERLALRCDELPTDRTTCTAQAVRTHVAEQQPCAKDAARCNSSTQVGKMSAVSGGGRTRETGRLVFRVVEAQAAQSPLAQPPLARSEQIQARISEVARTLGTNPRLKKLSQQQRERLVEFVAGNMLFVLLHELAHAAIDEFHLYVLGREEDAADEFAVLRLLRVGSDFSHRILVEAAEGWFLSDKRDRREGEPLAHYDEHGLDKQRAYQIVCLMVGSDPQEFKDLANETKLPSDRQETCHSKDYPKASLSWAQALKGDRRDTEQPKSKVEVVYGEGNGKFDAYAQTFRTLRILEVVAEATADALAWPVPFTLEMQSCGFINAAWVEADRKLTLCYEMAADFAELYRGFGNERSATNGKRKSRRSR
jgi:hypothetical protein